MSIAQRPYPSRNRGAQEVLRGRDPDILNDVVQPGVAAAIWQRTPETGFQRWLDDLPAENLPELRVVTPLDSVEDALLASCEQAEMPVCKERGMLVQDAAALAFIAARVLGTGTVRIRFDVSDEVMCPKFHLDAVPARLLCTYRGAGTQYVPESQLSDTGRVRSVKTGSVALFRGAAWPSDEKTALLHRSPAVGDGDKTRLFLVVDPLETNL